MQVVMTNGFSAGLCTAEPETDRFDDFLNAADKLLYQAKTEGRARVCGSLLSAVT